MNGTVTIVADHLPDLARQLADFASVALFVGYQLETGQEEYMSGISVAHNAAIHEFGSGSIPARPFLRHTIDEHGAAIGEIFNDALRDVIELRRDAVDAWLDIASQVHGLFLETLDTSPSWAIPNTLGTVIAKGHDHPLMGGAPPDDGPVRLLRENLTWSLRRHGSVIAEGR